MYTDRKNNKKEDNVWKKIAILSSLQRVWLNFPFEVKRFTYEHYVIENATFRCMNVL